MVEKEKQDFCEILEITKYLAENDPQSLLIIKATVGVLKARCDWFKLNSNFVQSS